MHAMQELYKPCNDDVKIPYNTKFSIYTFEFTNTIQEQRGKKTAKYNNNNNIVDTHKVPKKVYRNTAVDFHRSTKKRNYTDSCNDDDNDSALCR